MRTLFLMCLCKIGNDASVRTGASGLVTTVEVRCSSERHRRARVVVHPTLRLGPVSPSLCSQLSSSTNERPARVAERACAECEIVVRSGWALRPPSSLRSVPLSAAWTGSGRGSDTLAGPSLSPRAFAFAKPVGGVGRLATRPCRWRFEDAGGAKGRERRGPGVLPGPLKFAMTKLEPPLRGRSRWVFHGSPCMPLRDRTAPGEYTPTS